MKKTIKKELRIVEPFSELKEYFDSFKLDELLANPTLENGTIIRNIPYPVILHKKIEKWMAENNN